VKERKYGMRTVIALLLLSLVPNLLVAAEPDPYLDLAKGIVDEDPKAIASAINSMIHPVDVIYGWHQVGIHGSLMLMIQVQPLVKERLIEACATEDGKETHPVERYFNEDPEEMRLLARRWGTWVTSGAADNGSKVRWSPVRYLRSKV